MPTVVIGSAYGYGGLARLLAEMWEIAVGDEPQGVSLQRKTGCPFSPCAPKPTVALFSLFSIDTIFPLLSRAHSLRSSKATAP